MYRMTNVGAAAVSRLALPVVLALATPAPGSGQSGLVLTVTSAADGADSEPGNGVCAAGSGGCTLRAAIQEANALSGPDAIHFAIGSGVQTIDVGSALPAITDAVTIDGTTQPGFAGSPMLVINGTGVAGNADGLTISGAGVTVRGLAITGFPGNGMRLSGASGAVIETNYIGLGADGTTAAGNGDCGIYGQDATNNRIGGVTIAQRNVISGNTGKGAGGGIYLVGGGGNTVQGNFIGTDVTGMLERANQGRGIAVSGSTNNLIGGPGAGAGNLISGNRATGIRLMSGSDNNVIQGNFLGVNRTLSAYIANDRGVQIRGAHNTQVIANVLAGHTYDGVLIWGGGSNNLLQSNLIAFNGQGPVGDASESGWAGVWIYDGTGNRMVGNAIHSNAMLGVTLGGTWNPLANDAGDGDSGGNQQQNYPRLTSAVVSGSTTSISGVLNSSASTAYQIQVFADSQCDPSGFGEGRYFLGQTTITTGASGSGSFALTVGGSLTPGWIVTATATDPAGNSSAFSACVTVR